MQSRSPPSWTTPDDTASASTQRLQVGRCCRRTAPWAGQVAQLVHHIGHRYRVGNRRRHRLQRRRRHIRRLGPPAGLQLDLHRRDGQYLLRHRIDGVKVHRPPGCSWISSSVPWLRITRNCTLSPNGWPRHTASTAISYSPENASMTPCTSSRSGRRPSPPLNTPPPICHRGSDMTSTHRLVGSLTFTSTLASPWKLALMTRSLRAAP